MYFHFVCEITLTSRFRTSGPQLGAIGAAGVGTRSVAVLVRWLLGTGSGREDGGQQGGQRSRATARPGVGCQLMALDLSGPMCC